MTHFYHIKRLAMLYIQCPHCAQMFEVLELNCRIFRCGVYKKNNEQIPPHMPKEQCEQLAREDAIFGCGKPFELIPQVELEKGEKYSLDASYNVVKCEYK